MDQYFKSLNLDKREYVCLRCMQGGAKLSEWTINGHNDIFTLLTCTTDDAGREDVAEYNPEHRIAYGYVIGLESEWSSFSLDEIRTIRGSLGLPVERDLHFSPCLSSKIREC